MTNQYPVITIDGPSGAGKGTLAYQLAQKLGFSLLDSGALYRIIGLLAHKQGLLTGQVTDLEDQLEGLTQSLVLDFTVNHQTQVVEIWINGQPLQEDIRNEIVGAYASKVAVFGKVRQALLDLQRNMASRGGLVADGRDMGTVVFVDATAKIFLTASSEARAKRRVNQLLQAGKTADFDLILQEIQARDIRDQSRSIAPLVPAKDALILDSSELNPDEVYKLVCEFLTQKGISIENPSKQ